MTESDITAEEPPPPYVVFILVFLFFITGLLGFLICHLLKKKGYRCRTGELDEEEEEDEKLAGDEDEENQDTVEQILKCIIENEANMEAFKEMLGNQGVCAAHDPRLQRKDSLGVLPPHLHTVHSGSDHTSCHLCSQHRSKKNRRRSRTPRAKQRPGEQTVFSVGRFRVTHTDKHRPSQPLADSGEQLDQSQDSEERREAGRDRREGGYNLRNMFKDVRPPENGTGLAPGRRRKSLTLFGLRRSSDPVGVKALTLPGGGVAEGAGLRLPPKPPVVLEEPVQTSSPGPSNSTMAVPPHRSPTVPAMSHSPAQTLPLTSEWLPVKLLSNKQGEVRGEGQVRRDGEVKREEHTEETSPGPLQTSTPLSPGPPGFPLPPADPSGFAQSPGPPSGSAPSPGSPSGSAPSPGLLSGSARSTSPLSGSAPSPGLLSGSTHSTSPLSGSAPSLGLISGSAHSTSPLSGSAHSPGSAPGHPSNPALQVPCRSTSSPDQAPGSAASLGSSGGLVADTPQDLGPTPTLTPSPPSDSLSLPPRLGAHTPESTSPLTQPRLEGRSGSVTPVALAKVTPPTSLREAEEGGREHHPGEVLGGSALVPPSDSPSSSLPVGGRVGSVTIVKASPDSQREFSVVTMLEEELQPANQRQQELQPANGATAAATVQSVAGRAATNISAAAASTGQSAEAGTITSQSTAAEG